MNLPHTDSLTLNKLPKKKKITNEPRFTYLAETLHKKTLCPQVLTATAYLTQAKNRQLDMLKSPQGQNFSYIRIFPRYLTFTSRTYNSYYFIKSYSKLQNNFYYGYFTYILLKSTSSKIIQEIPGRDTK